MYFRRYIYMGVFLPKQWAPEWNDQPRVLIDADLKYGKHVLLSIRILMIPLWKYVQSVWGTSFSAFSHQLTPPPTPNKKKKQFLSVSIYTILIVCESPSWFDERFWPFSSWHVLTFWTALVRYELRELCWKLYGNPKYYNMLLKIVCCSVIAYVYRGI